MIAIVYGHNELDRLKESIEKLKENVDDTDIIIAVDNGSADGTGSWLQYQKDIDTVCFDEEIQTFSLMMNAIIKEYGIEDDILFVQASCMASEHSIAGLKKAIKNNSFVGIAAPMSNDSDVLYPWVKREEPDAEADITDNDLLYCLGIENGTFLVRREVFEKNGLFDEKLFTIESAIEDYIIRAISEGYVAAYCKDVYFHNLEENKRRDPYMDRAGIDLQYMRNKWNMHYFNKYANYNLVSYITDDRNAEIRVLEIGCDCGATLIDIKNRFPKSKVLGLELNEQAVKLASKYCDARVGNIEDMNLQYAPNSFDYIIFGDVLEHLREPEKIVNYCKTFLKEGGCILTSIPNLMNVSVIKELINGNFTYTETGLLDKTHIHMFTYYEIVRMFGRCNYAIEEIRTVILPQFVDKEYIDKLMQLSSVKERALFETFQYVVKARVKDNLLYDVSPIVTLQDKIYNIAEKPYKGVHLWKYLFEELSQGINGEDGNKNITFKQGYISDVFQDVGAERILKLESMLDKLEEKEILFAMVSTLRRQYNGKYEHTALDSYINAIEPERYTVLENLSVYTDDIVYTKNRVQFDEGAVPCKYGIEETDMREITQYVIKEIVEPLRRIFRSDITKSLVVNSIFRASRIMKERKAYISFFSEVLDRVKPKVIIYTHGVIPWLSYLHEAAQLKNIKTVEIAHGAVSKNLVYPPQMKCANYYLTHSELEKDYMKKIGHDNVYAVGKPGIYDGCNEGGNNGERMVVSFISSVERGLFEMAIRMSYRLQGTAFRVVYKSHTSEQLTEGDVELAEKAGVGILNGSVDVRDLFGCSDIVVGMHSSAMVDALPYRNIKIIILTDENRNGAGGNQDFFMNLIDAGEITGVDYEEELYREIITYEKGRKYRSKPNLYWPADAENLFRMTIKQIEEL